MNRIIKQYIQPAFLICLFVLVVTAGGMTFIKNYFEFWFVKQPIQPNKPLSQLDEAKLEPFEVIDKSKIDNKEILDSLGTEEYIQWTMRNTNDNPDQLVKNIMAFITYYEKPDAVPHVPEECYTGGGYQKSSSKAIVFNIEDIRNPGQTRKIPGKIVTFSRSAAGFGGRTFPVLYFFNVNGEYVNTRTEARIELGKNLRGRHSYFSKVEFVFNRTRSLNIEEAVQMSEELLAVMLPVLEEEHWPTKEQLRGKN